MWRVVRERGGAWEQTRTSSLPSLTASATAECNRLLDRLVYAFARAEVVDATPPRITLTVDPTISLYSILILPHGAPSLGLLSTWLIHALALGAAHCSAPEIGVHLASSSAILY